MIFVDIVQRPRGYNTLEQISFLLQTIWLKYENMLSAHIELANRILLLKWNRA